MNTVNVRKVEIGKGIPKICVPVVGITRDDIIDAACKAKETADLVEWRADWYEDVLDFKKTEKMMEELRPQAVKRIETRLVLEAIAKAENIEITDERIDEELAKMAEAYKMEVEKLKEFMGENEKEQMKMDLAVQDAVTFLVDNAVEE